MSLPIGQTVSIHERRELAYAFVPQRVGLSLHPSILAVAETRVEGAWRAFIGLASCGDTEVHCDSLARVALYGQRLSEPIARAMFPEFKDLPYAR